MIKKKNWSFIIMTTLLLSFVCAVIILPFMHMIAVSFSSSTEAMKGTVGLIPKGFNIEMYKKVFENKEILTSYRNTIVYTTIGTTLSLVVTSMGAYALSKKSFIGYRVFSFMIIFTMFFSGGMIPTYLIVRELGILDTMWCCILPTAVTTWNFIIMRSFFSAFPHEIEEAGAIDGLNDIGIFLRLVVPSSKAVFATIGLYYAVGLWNAYFGPFIYLSDRELFPLQLILREVLAYGTASADGGADTAVSEASLKYATILVSVLPIMCVYPFIQKYFAKGVMIGSVKG
ncbi:MAG: carbohydrate ABC transporter permease [Clostridia bacterium]